MAKKCWLKANDGGIAVCGTHGYDYTPTCEFATCEACGKADTKLGDDLLCETCAADFARIREHEEGLRGRYQV